MTAPHDTNQSSTTTAQARRITQLSVVTNLVVRAAGTIPARLDLAHVGTAEQQLGLTLGTVPVYLRTGMTARAIADGWSAAAVAAQSLGPALAGRRPLLVGSTTVAAMVRFAGTPRVISAFQPARAGGAVPAMLRTRSSPATAPLPRTTPGNALERSASSELRDPRPDTPT